MSGLLSTVLAGILSYPLLAAAVPGATLTVAAASDLTNLESALAAGFEKTNPTIHVQFVTSASAVLRQQIDNGAPYDIFLSANARYVDELAQKRKIEPNSVLTYANGALAILWRDGKPHAFKDLTKKEVRSVAVPNPQLAPYGVAAIEALHHAGLWAFVSQKLVYGENVRQTLQLFESGNADAVLTSDSLLQGKPAQVIPADWYAPIVQKAGIVAGTPNQALAEQFLHYLKGPAQEIFARFGFSRPVP